MTGRARVLPGEAVPREGDLLALSLTYHRTGWRCASVIAVSGRVVEYDDVVVNRLSEGAVRWDLHPPASRGGLERLGRRREVRSTAARGVMMRAWDCGTSTSTTSGSSAPSLREAA